MRHFIVHVWLKKVNAETGEVEEFTWIKEVYVEAGGFKMLGVLCNICEGQGIHNYSTFANTPKLSNHVTTSYQRHQECKLHS